MRTDRRRGPARTRRAGRAAPAVLACAAVLMSLAAPAAAPDPQLVAAPKPTSTAVNYAVAVDQSASLAPEDIKAEKAAAARIALGGVSAASHITVFGFAAAESADQRAVDPVCPRTKLDAAGRESIGACVDKLRSRKKDEGTGTDFPTAIRQGVHDLSSGTDPSVPRVLFLLTDGKMDVSGSDKYGDEAHREAEGERQLKVELKNAAAKNVQIWPLGFGSAPDKAQLDRMAAGGYQKGCVDLPSAKPTARKVSGAKDVGPALERIFAAAHCMRYGPGPSKRPPAVLPITISPLATVGSIVVDKGDAEVSVTYIDPLGNKVPTTGKFNDSVFELAGGGSTVEALKIIDPVPGVWKVDVKAPEGHRSLPVAVSVLWQGELRGSITMDPPSPQAGQKATVTMRLLTREGYEIKDPADYAGLKVSSALTGDGFAPLPLRLADDGKGADPSASDGSFTGSVTVPESANGALKVRGTLTASGLSADTRSEGGQVSPGTLPVTAALSPVRGEGHPGDTVTANLSVTNTTDAPHTLRLSLADVRAGLLTLSPTEIVVEPGASATHEVKIRIGQESAFEGPLHRHDPTGVGATLAVHDATDDDRVLERAPLSVQVTREGTFLERYRWALAGGAAVLVVGVLLTLAWLRQRRIRRDPYGLMLHLIAEDGTVLGVHKAGHGQKQWYAFDIAEAHSNPRIERRPYGQYAVQRSLEGGAVIRRNSGTRSRTRLTTTDQVELTDRLSLALGPEPTRDSPRPPEADPEGSGAPGDATTGPHDDYL
ncbi:VWA domain-containing protein [Streptomyces sp. NPDC007346]|uniref:VWA domain-containing protein n=1 Tax=Streptomyces sp. NPDC007346 TaxID=3154682 RepID=UPI0034541FC3